MKRSDAGDVSPVARFFIVMLYLVSLAFGMVYLLHEMEHSDSETLFRRFEQAKSSPPSNIFQFITDEERFKSNHTLIMYDFDLNVIICERETGEQ